MPEVTAGRKFCPIIHQLDVSLIYLTTFANETCITEIENETNRFSWIDHIYKRKMLQKKEYSTYLAVSNCAVLLNYKDVTLKLNCNLILY